MTELEEILETMVRHVPGASFAAVAGMDGLVVEQVPSTRDELPEVVAELTTMLSVAQRTVGEILAGGSIERVSLRAKQLSLGIWLVSDDFYCLVAGDVAIDTSATSEAASNAVERIRGALT